MTELKYLKESWYNDKNEFTKDLEQKLNSGWDIKYFNTYGSDRGGYSVALLAKLKPKHNAKMTEFRALAPK